MGGAGGAHCARPARAPGFGALRDFLERRFAAFKGMQRAGRLRDVIRKRKTQLSEALFRRDPAALERLTAGLPTSHSWTVTASPLVAPAGCD